MKCMLCDYSNEDLKKLSNHIRTAHGLGSEQYTIKVFHGGIRPVCPECSEQTRYVSFSFKEYCKNHSKLAMKVGGSKGGHAPAWNRGKTKDTDTRLALQSSKVSGSGNHFYGKQHAQETIQRISIKKTLETSSIEERLFQRQSELRLLTPLNEYHSRQMQYLIFECVKCGEQQSKTLQAFERGSRCYKCYPVGKSNWELSVFDFVRSLSSDAVSGDKSQLSPKEIDIYVHSKKFGIECHGLYWHSEAANTEQHFDKNKHLQKFKLAEEKGINLLQLFEDEWRDKRPICESMIRHRLGLNLERCRTWSTSVVELSTQEEREFFNRTHISGYTPSKICWGIKERSGRIVASLSLRTPRQSSKYEGAIEISRFSTEQGVSVPGGLSKLLKHAKIWCDKANIKVIMTYVDRRIGAGKGYEAAGFKLTGSTAPDYWYTDNELRYDRFKFRAQDGKPEKQIAAESNVHRIWGCGSQVMTLSVL